MATNERREEAPISFKQYRTLVQLVAVTVILTNMAAICNSTKTNACVEVKEIYRLAAIKVCPNKWLAIGIKRKMLYLISCIQICASLDELIDNLLLAIFASLQQGWVFKSPLILAEQAWCIVLDRYIIYFKNSYFNNQC